MNATTTAATPHGASTPGTTPGVVRADVEHDTTYHYRSGVESAQHLAFLQPVDDALQRLERFELDIQPVPAFQSSGRDVYGNTRTLFGFASVHRELVVRATSRLALLPVDHPRWQGRSVPWERAAAHLRYRAGAPFNAAAEFAQPSPFVPRLHHLREWAAAAFQPGRPVADVAIALMQQVHRELHYDPASTEIDTPIEQVLAQRRGVCQDYSHLMIGALRMFGLAARYVSGYLLSTPALPVDPSQGNTLPAPPPLVGAEASHAWVSVWCPLDDGSEHWLELDPTNNLLPDRSHVRLAVGRDFGDVTPLRGVIRGGGDHTLTVRVRTTPVHGQVDRELLET